MIKNGRVLLGISLVVCLAAMQALCQGTNTSGLPPSSTGEVLTSESLEMPRTQIWLSDRMLRLFNGRGDISLRDKTVTGLQGLQFPPVEFSDYRFTLAIKEDPAGVLIQDAVADLYQQWLEGKGKHPLGLNNPPWSKYPEGPYVMLLQNTDWEPNLLRRTGTFHKLLNGHWVSFAIRTEASVSAQSDEVYLKVEIENRMAEPMNLTMIPNQEADRHKDAKHSDAYTLSTKNADITVVSDLPQSAAEGWKWTIPGHATNSAYFAIVVTKSEDVRPKLLDTQLASKAKRAQDAMAARLQWASSQLPQIISDDPQLNALYRRCILSILESRWDRKGMDWNPFYAVGTWIWAVPWDMSYVSQAVSMLDPSGLRENFVEYLMKNTSPYAQDTFARMRILKDYLLQTGDTAFLNQKVGDATIFQIMKQRGKDLVKNYRIRPDGLFDFGGGSDKFLEIRTDGYDHVVAADNGMAAAYLQQIAIWCRDRNDPDAAVFEQWSQQLVQAINAKLWDSTLGWVVNYYPDNSRQIVWSYHAFDLLDTGVLSKAKEQGMVSHLKEGEFLGPYGVYSISKIDTIHWDMEDADWGGGGQYTGEPLRLVQSLYRLGYPELAWNILTRCTLWTEHYPYIPQEIFTDSGSYPEVEMPVALASGAGVQAVVFGVFGVHPQMDGALQIAPSYHHELGHARLQNYRFRGHTFAVAMDPLTYRVWEDDKLVAQKNYGDTVQFPPAGNQRSTAAN